MPAHQTAVQYTSVQASICGVGSGSRSAWRSSISHKIDLHTSTEVRPYIFTKSFCPIPMSCHALPCLALPRPALPRNAMRSGRAMPCHALPRHAPSLAAPILHSLRLTFPQSPIQPSRRSAHKQDFTLVSELLQPSVLCPVQPCPVPQSRCPTCPASLSFCQSANLSLPRDLVSVCDARFDSLCSHCFALPCLALLPLARLTSPIPSRLFASDFRAISPPSVRSSLPVTPARPPADDIGLAALSTTETRLAHRRQASPLLRRPLPPAPAGNPPPHAAAIYLP